MTQFPVYSVWKSLGTLAASGLVFVATGQAPPDEIRLKDYKPRSIFRIPETRVEKARHGVIDVHSHDYARTDADVSRL